MPSTSEKQRRLFGAALACKRGEGECNPTLKEIASHMTINELRNYASKVSKPKKG